MLQTRENVRFVRKFPIRKDQNFLIDVISLVFLILHLEKYMTTLCLDDLDLKFDVIDDERLSLIREIPLGQVIATSKENLLEELMSDKRWQKAS